MIMIIWIASYPKSGNTWVRSFLSSYYYTNNGEFNFELLKNIPQYPTSKFFRTKIERPEDIIYQWSQSQEEICKRYKIIFLKTHNALITINNKHFTLPRFTKGFIYIVRDPRNVVTSLKNHYSLNYDEALDFMNNQKKYIFDNRKKFKIDYSTTHFLTSWSSHYKSWINTNLFPKYILKYEDLIKKPAKIFRELIEFTNKISNLEKDINQIKLNKSIESTNFAKLQSLENENLFNEYILDKNKKKIKFFLLGPKNNWKGELTDKFGKKINSVFSKDINKLDYN